jgi:hypothetical protein
MDEQLANALESAVKHTVQKLTLWRAAQLQLEIYKRAGHAYSIRNIHEAEKSLAFSERVLCGVTESMIDEATKITNALKSKEPRSMARFALRGD